VTADSDNGVPSYSADALDVLHAFHETSVVIFVEGEADKIYWNWVAAEAGVRNYTLDSVGGGSQINEKIRLVAEDDAAIVVACDSDHSAFLPDTVVHERVVRTHGYSIENTMYCPNTLRRLLIKLSRSLSVEMAVVNGWYERFSLSVFPLLIYSIANQLYGTGVEVFGNSSARHLVNNRSPNLSDAKIESHIESFKDKFTEGQLRACRRKVVRDGREIRLLVKGHYLSVAVANFLKEETMRIRGNKITLSNEHLFTETVDACQTCDADPPCTPREDLTGALGDAVASAIAAR
jgi:Protein of unknown function (DUF4435)